MGSLGVSQQRRVNSKKQGQRERQGGSEPVHEESRRIAGREGEIDREAGGEVR